MVNYFFLCWIGRNFAEINIEVERRGKARVVMSQLSKVVDGLV